MVELKEAKLTLYAVRTTATKYTTESGLESLRLKPTEGTRRIRMDINLSRARWSISLCDLELQGRFQKKSTRDSWAPVLPSD
jgi:hypothetical protein